MRIDDDDQVLAPGAVRRHNPCQTDGSENARTHAGELAGQWLEW